MQRHGAEGGSVTRTAAVAGRRPTVAGGCPRLSGTAAGERRVPGQRPPPQAARVRGRADAGRPRRPAQGLRPRRCRCSAGTSGFDPQNDPIVRIEVGRLRRDLEHYYLTDGRDDPIRITIPKGHYVPAFEVRDEPTPEPRLPRLRAAGSLWPRLPAPGRGRRPVRVVVLIAAVAIWAPWRGRRAGASWPGRR